MNFARLLKGSRSADPLGFVGQAIENQQALKTLGAIHRDRLQKGALDQSARLRAELEETAGPLLGRSLVEDALDYGIDVLQRSVLFWEMLRQARLASCAIAQRYAACQRDGQPLSALEPRAAA